MEKNSLTSLYGLVYYQSRISTAFEEGAGRNARLILLRGCVSSELILQAFLTSGERIC